MVFFVYLYAVLTPLQWWGSVCRAREDCVLWNAGQGCFVTGGEFQPNQEASLGGSSNGSQWNVEVMLKSSQVEPLSIYFLEKLG